MRILLEGRPGVGKTTVVRRLAELLRERGVPARGFFTEELRSGGRRVGFTVETLGGERATLAHVDLPGPPRVGKYGVDLEAFERAALQALTGVPAHAVVLIDELGKMELASDAFCDAVRRLLERPGPLVATVHVFRHRLTDALKARPDVECIPVTLRNRDALPERLAARLADRG